MIATDSGKDGLKSSLPVEDVDYKSSLQRYSQGRHSIVICSWMPLGFDMTNDFRKAGVDEYILIGDTSATGTESSWGISDDSIQQYKREGYNREFLSNIMEYQLPNTILKPGIGNYDAVASFKKNF